MRTRIWAVVLILASTRVWAADADCKTTVLHELLNGKNKYTPAEIHDVISDLCGPANAAAKPVAAAAAPAAAAAAEAAAEPAKKTEAQVGADAVAASSSGNWAGDKVNIRMNSGPIFHSATPNSPALSAAPETKLHVTKDDNTTLTVDVREAPSCPAGTECVKQDTKYTASKADVMALRYNKVGWVYGVLVAPYKFHLKEKTLTASASLGPYMGYSWGNDNLGLTLVGSAGITALSSEQVQAPSTSGASGAGSGSTTSKTNSQAGFSVSTGLIWTVSKGTGLHAGVLIGKDWAGSDAATPYKYEGKPWLSVEIGMPFN
jgi:hypothetical protein